MRTSVGGAPSRGPALREAGDVDWATEKWGGHPHYRSATHLLGEDEHGTWLWGPAGRTIYRGDQVLFVAEQDTLVLLVADRWWSPTWWLGHPELDVYVNIGTPPVWGPDRVTMVDLDLDVIRFSDGRVEVVDRDEFEDHQHAFGYPPDVVAAAERATAEVFDLVVHRSRHSTEPPRRHGSSTPDDQPSRRSRPTRLLSRAVRDSTLTSTELLAVALSVLTSWPAAGSTLAFFQLLLSAANAACSCRRLLGILDPADELVAG